jgi:hypothetical protein
MPTSAKTRDTVVENLLGAVTSLSLLSTSDSDELAETLEVIGARVRSEMWASKQRGLLLFAKTIFDHAATTRMG